MTLPSASRGQRVVLLVAVAVVFAYLLVSAREPLRLNWGDPWSDANVLTALNYSSKYGFLATSFTDILDIGPLTKDSYRYTHYPPFAEIFYGCVRKIAGGEALDITVYRLFAIAFAGIGLHAFHRYVRDTWGGALASWSTVLCATNLLWIQFADAMHQAPILFASGMTALAAVPVWVRGGPVAQRVALAVGTYVCFLTAYDYYFFLPIAALLTARILGVPLLSKRMLRLAVFVALSGAAAIVTKAIFVTGALGWKGFLEDVHFQFLERATTKFSPDYRSGFVIILLLRWSMYFTPVVFIVAAALLVRLARRVRLASVRAFLVGDQTLSEDPASILILLAAGLPFILVFSELAVEQVLPSQVMIPFFAVGCGHALSWLRRERVEFATLGMFVAWQLAFMVRIPKTFLDRDATEKIAAYLRANDNADFLVTNLMSDGPIQYFFDRHLHMPPELPEQAPEAYMEIASRNGGVVHAVYYDDPGTRLIDKSLWYLLPRKSQWALLGSPYLFREQALGVIAEWDRGVLAALRRSGTEVLTLPGVHVFRIATDVDARRRAARAKLATMPPTRVIDFGVPAADVHKLSGFRYRENYPGVPGFSWTIATSHKKSFLTKRGLEFRPTPAGPTHESRLLVRFEPARDHRVLLIAWGAIPHQTLRATIDGIPVLPEYDFGEMQQQRDIWFDVPKDVIGDDPVKEIVFQFRDVADYGGGVGFGTMEIDPALDP